MKCLRHESRSRKQNRKTNPIRTAAVGFSLALAFLPSCEPPLSKSEAMEQVRSHDAEKRVEAVEALEGDGAQLKKLAMHSKYGNVRLAAVETLPDTIGPFDEIAMESDYADSALAALERISGDNEYILSLVAERSKRSEVRMAAIKRIGEDVEKLTSVISDSKYEDVKIAAADVLASMMDELEDLTAFVGIAKYSTNDHARVAAVSELKIKAEYSLLQMVAVDSVHEDTRAIALTMLNTGGIPLTYVSGVVRKLVMKEAELKGLEPEYQRTRTAAADLLAYKIDEVSDAELLKYVYRYSYNDSARAAALMKMEGMVGHITDVEALMDLAAHSQSAETRVAAIERIHRYDILKYFMLNSTYPDVRVAAVERVAENLPFLEEIALGGYSDDARMAAIQLLSRNVGMLKEARLREPEASSALARLERSKYCLYGVAKGLIGRQGGNKEMLVAALDGLAPVVPEMGDYDMFDAVFTEIALHSRIAEGRLAAVNIIRRSYKVEEIAGESEYEDTRLAAIDKLEKDRYWGSRMLGRVAAISKYKDTRLAAFKRIAKDYDELESVAIHSPYVEMAMMALRRLKGRAKPLSVVVLNAEGKLRDTALEMLTPLVYETNYTGALECIGMYSPDADARKEAVERARKNRRLLRYLSRNSEFKDTREMAKEMLSD